MLEKFSFFFYFIQILTTCLYISICYSYLKFKIDIFNAIVQIVNHIAANFALLNTIYPKQHIYFKNQNVMKNVYIIVEDSSNQISNYHYYIPL